MARASTLALVLCLGAGLPAIAGEVAVGKPAPPLPEVAWGRAPEATTLDGLRGYVVLFGFVGKDDGGPAAAWFDLWQEMLWKKGLRVLVLAHGEEAVADPAGGAYAVGSVADLGPYAEGAEAGEAFLVGADGLLAWRGPAGEVPAAKVAALVGKVRPPAGPPPVGALAAWQRLAERAREVGAPALALDAYDAIRKAAKDAPEGAAAAAAAAADAEVRADPAAKAPLAAAKALSPLFTDWMRVGESARSRSDLAKRLDRFVEKNAGTRAGAQARLLLDTVRDDPALAQVRRFVAAERIDTEGSGWRTSLPKPPVLSFTAGRTYVWVLETSEGTVRVRFFPDVAPMHVSSTIYLTTLGYYDGLTFHRVIPGFMAQGGCPLGTGTGNPGYAYAGEYSPKARHDRPGLLSMANAGPGTDGSQFFLTFRPARDLDDKHTVFGEVTSGMDVLKKLEEQGTGGGTPKKRLTIVRARVEVS